MQRASHHSGRLRKANSPIAARATIAIRLAMLKRGRLILPRFAERAMFDLASFRALITSRCALSVSSILEPLHLRATRADSAASGGQRNLLRRLRLGRRVGSTGTGKHAGRGPV